MPEHDWAFPVALQPQADLVTFDLPARLASIVRVRSEVPVTAFTAATLGIDRHGNGIAVQVAGQILIVTVGYLTVEASEVWITTHTGKVIAGHALAFDEVTGLGLVLPLSELGLPTIPIGVGNALDAHSELWIFGFGGPTHCTAGQLQGRRNFASFWEYLLRDGMLITPMHPDFGGSALIDGNGALVGIGALALHDPAGDARHNSNLFVPTDTLPTIIHQVLSTGHPNTKPRPWLGIYAADQAGQVVIMDMAAKGPTALARLRPGDVIAAVDDEPVLDLSHFYQLLWQHEAGSTINLNIKRKDRHRTLPVRSTTRDAFFVKPVQH